MRTRTLVVFLVIIACVVAVILAVAYFLPISLFGSAPVAYPAELQVYTGLASSSPLFLQGVNASNSDNWAQAVSDFEQVLAVTTDPGQKLKVEFWLAPALQQAGDGPQAVSIYQAIAADDAQSDPRVRASAVQELGVMYYRSLDPQITQAIFSVAPYANLYVVGNIGLSYRNLFAYATSIYPVATAELRTAQWYANQLLNQSSVDSTTTAQYKQIIRLDIAAADPDLAYMAADPTQINDYLNTLIIRANLVAKMTQLGDTSYGDPESGFKQVLALYAASDISARDGVARVYYAGYLAQTFGTARSSDINTILAPVTATTTPAAVSRFLTVNEQNAGGLKATIVSIASIDSAFKKVLVSLGWTAADFK